MLKKTFILVTIFIAHHTNTMDEPYRLSTLPPDIQNRVAYFLTRDVESEQEFIERTRIKNRIPMDTINNYHTQYVLSNPDSSNYVRSAYDLSYDNRKIALLSVYEYNPLFTARLTIVDLKKEKTMHHGPFSHANHLVPYRIALSPHADMLAIISQEIDERTLSPYYMGPARYKNIVKIIRFAEGNKEKIRTFHINGDLSDASSDIASVAFNTQGTHVIVHGCPQAHAPHAKTIPNIHYQIFPLKINLEPKKVNANPVVEKSLLQTYLRNRLVCKNLNQ